MAYHQSCEFRQQSTVNNTLFILMKIGIFRNLISLYTHRNVASNYTREYDKRIFFMKYPFEIQNFKTYFFVIVEEGYLLYGTALFWMCSDTLFAQISTHTSLQFEVSLKKFRYHSYEIERPIQSDFSKYSWVHISKIFRY